MKINGTGREIARWVAPDGWAGSWRTDRSVWARGPSGEWQLCGGPAATHAEAKSLLPRGHAWRESGNQVGGLLGGPRYANARAPGPRFEPTADDRRLVNVCGVLVAARAETRADLAEERERRIEVYRARKEAGLPLWDEE